MSKEMEKKTKKKASGFVKDFKAFITRGNVVDMAVAVIIGAAFGAIVTGLVNFILNPVIGLAIPAGSLENWKTPLGDPIKDAVTGEYVLSEAGEYTYKAYIQWGAWIQTIISFLIIALVLFLIIRAVTKASSTLRRREMEAAAAAAEKAKEEEKVKAEAAAAVEAEKAAKLQQFYDNVEKQTKLLEEIAKK